MSDIILPQQKLHIIEWQHMDLRKFYPMALTASWTIRGVLYPFNVVKARLQLQKRNNAYRGMRHAFADIYRTEGIRSFYRGFWVTLPQIGGSFIYSTMYEKMRSLLHLNANIQSPLLVSALAGGVASLFTQFIFVPTDVVSQHMMIYNNPQQFTGGSIKKKNMAVIDYLQNDKLHRQRTLGLRVINAVYNVDGLFGFYRGFLSSLMLYFPHSMCFWSAYYTWLSIFKKFYAKLENQPTTAGDLHGLLLLQAVSGGLGGISAAFCTNSLEVLRVRIQVHRMGYTETLHRLYHEEGRHVFTKGLAPRMINNGFSSFLIMTGYEAIKRLCVLPEYREAIVW